MRDYMRTYALLRMGISPDVAEDMPAAELDWLLKIHEAVLERQRKEAERG